MILVEKSDKGSVGVEAERYQACISLQNIKEIHNTLALQRALPIFKKTIPEQITILKAKRPSESNGNCLIVRNFYLVCMRKSNQYLTMIYS